MGQSKLKLTKRVFSRRYENKKYKFSDPDTYLGALRKKIRHRLKRLLLEHTGMKVQFCLEVKLEKQVYGPIEDEIRYCEPCFLSEMTQLTAQNRIGELINDAFEKILSRFDAFIAYGSGWKLRYIKSLDMRAYKIVKMLRGGCFVDLPAILRRKKALLSIDCKKGYCFVYSVAACIKKVTKNPNRASKYEDIVKQLRGVKKWVSIDEIDEFERLNRIRLNVFQWITPTKIRVIYSTSRKVGHICDLLLYNQHYFVIRNLSALINVTGSTAKNKRHICRRCLITFTRLTSLAKHNKICSLKGRQIFCAPPRGTKIQFKNFGFTVRKEFTYYADFETMLKPCHVKRGNKTMLIKRHVPVSFGLLRVCINPAYNKGPIVYHGINVLQKFWEILDIETIELRHILETVYFPLQMDAESELEFERATRCYSCKCKFSLYNKKVRDHCHLIGPHQLNYRHTLCNRCNLTYGASNHSRYPIIIHNFSGYDSHLIISQLDKCGKTSLSVIPKNTERYLSLRVNCWQFIDSLAFLPASLNTLVNSLKQKGINSFIHTTKLNKNEEKLVYLLNKNPYPYNFATTLDDYNLPELPPLEAFKNEMTNKQISTAEYEYANKLYNIFHCHTFLDYHMQYLKCDVTLLADVFENYRTISLAEYQLDPAYYISAPQLSFDAMLRMSNEKLDCIHDLDMTAFLERGIRGGISVVSKKLSLANNLHMGSAYDDTKPSSYISYFDCCNLYGHAMKYPLPYKKFRWLSKKEIARFDLKAHDIESNIGYILEVDLLYPKTIHDKTQFYPLAPEKMCPSNFDLSPLTLKLKQKLGISNTTSHQSKLIPNLNNKKKYIVHYLNLQYYLQEGMILKKIRRILKFCQKRWLAPFIKTNTVKRQNATSEFDKLYFKQLNNSCYGKMLENKRKRINLKLVTTEREFDTLVGKPNFVGVKEFNNNLAGITLQKPKVVLDKPIYAGFTILDISKLVMFTFFKLITQQLYTPDRVDLLLTDTDSFIFEIRTKNLYDDLQKIQKYLDTSNYPKDHPLYNPKNKMVPGTFKDEFPPSKNPGILTEFCGLKSKIYSLITLNQQNTLKAKGLNRTSICYVQHSDYVNCLKQDCSIETKNINSFRSFAHILYTTKSAKTVLNSYCDKRYFLNNGVDSLPFGHYLIDILDSKTPETSVCLPNKSASVILINSIKRLTYAKMEKKTFKLNENKSVTITVFKNVPYFHFDDTRKDKSITFTQAELQKIIKKGSKLLETSEVLVAKLSKKKDNKIKRDSATSDSSDSDSDEYAEKKKSKKRRREETL
jgi:hypothetical protein